MDLVNSSNFLSETAEGVVLVDFFTPTCGPCRKMIPILEECSDFVRIIKFDVSEDIEFATKMGIRSVPTFILFKDGQEVRRSVGFQGKEDIKEMIQGALS